MSNPRAGGWVPSTIETARIVNVNIDDWSVDVTSLPPADKKYFDIQVMSPYFHYSNGEGIYCMPEVGALVWVCRPTEGEFGTPFVLGYQAPYDGDSQSYRNGRQSLNPGDIMLRTRDENFIILRRGGVVQIGATPTAQRIFIPIRNIIKDFCENYELYSFGGELTWTTDRTDQTTTGDAPTTFSLKAKRLANEPGQVAQLTIGSHGEGDPTILKLDIFESGQNGAKKVASMTFDDAGNATWTLVKDWTVTAKGNIGFESKEGDISFKADQGAASLEASKAVSVKSDTSDVTVEAAGAIKETSTGHTIEAPSIKLGGAGASHPVAWGDAIQGVFTQLLADLSTAAAAQPAPGGFQSATVAGMLNTIFGNVSKTM